MEYLGEYQLGDMVPLSMVSVNASGTPTLPDAAPYCDLFSASAHIATFKLPVLDLTRRLFGFQLPLGAAYATGTYDVVYRWLLSASELGASARFEIVPGGHGDGSIIAMTHFRPNLERASIVFQTDGGFVGAYRNPRVE